MEKMDIIYDKKKTKFERTEKIYFLYIHDLYKLIIIIVF